MFKLSFIIQNFVKYIGFAFLLISFLYNIKFYFKIENLKNQILKYKKEILILKAKNSKLFVKKQELQDKLKNEIFNCQNLIKKQQLLKKIKQEKININIKNSNTKITKPIKIKKLPEGNYTIIIP